MGRGVRTVQRWERDLKMPVHRIGTGPRSPACAFPAELDAWLRRVSAHKDFSPRQEQTLRKQLSQKSQEDSSVAVSRVLVQRSAELAQRMVEATYMHRQQAESLRKAFNEMKKLLQESRGLAARRREAHKKSPVSHLPNAKGRAAGD